MPPRIPPLRSLSLLLRSQPTLIHNVAIRTLRTAAGRRRAPDRMVLSAKVGSPSRSSATPAAAKKRKPSSEMGPFGAMNRRDVPAGFAARVERQAERQQDGRKKEGRSRKDKERDRDPYKHLKMQRALTEVTYSQRAQIKQKIEDLTNFEGFGLLPSVMEGLSADVLKGLTEVSPTPVQRVAIPALMRPLVSRRKPGAAASRSKTEFLIAAETGSGKTLAYLLPAINAIKLEENQQKDVSAFKHHQRQEQNPYELEPPPISTAETDTTGRPKIIVLVPTSELVAQVGKVAKGLSHKAKLRVAMISSAYSTTVIRKRLFAEQGIDLLVSTPHLLKSIADNEPNVLSKVSHLILDEADSLLDRSFIELTQAIMDRSRPSLKQLIFCSATIPRSMDKFLLKRYPETIRLVTPNLHAIPRRVQLNVVDIDKIIYHGNRNLACADTLQTISNQALEAASSVLTDPDSEPATQSKSVLVFVNEREAATEVAEYLRSKGFMALAFNRDVRPEDHGSLLQPFVSRDFAASFEDQVSTEEKKTQDKSDAGPETRTVSPPTRRRALVRNLQVLVTTDLGSRGIDTVAVRDVILYDVPHTTVDFIHRLGRTGRMNRRGKGYVLVGKKDRKDIVKEVREGMFRGAALI